MIEAVNLDTGERLSFDANTACTAASKLIYFLKLRKREECKIDKTESGRYLYVIHNGETWGIRNE